MFHVNSPQKNYMLQQLFKFFSNSTNSRLTSNWFFFYWYKFN